MQCPRATSTMDAWAEASFCGLLCIVAREPLSCLLVPQHLRSWHRAEAGQGCYKCCRLPSSGRRLCCLCISEVREARMANEANDV